LAVDAEITGEYDELEAEIGREEVVNVVWPAIRRAHNMPERKAFTDKCLGCERLVGSIDDDRMFVLNAYAASIAGEMS
jgi:hypothetical protein